MKVYINLNSIEYAFNIFLHLQRAMLNELFKRPRHLVQQSVEHMHVEANVETFKKAFKCYLFLLDEGT